MTTETGGAGAHGPSPEGVRQPLLVILIVTAAAILLTAAVVWGGVHLGSTSPELNFPGESVSQVLLYGQSVGVYSLYSATFTVPGQPGDGVLVKVGTAGEVNVSCGGPSSILIGDDYVCTEGLFTNWNESDQTTVVMSSFNGTTWSSVIELAPGPYTIAVNVHVGSPPLAVVLVPFSVTAEVAILN